MKQLTLQTVAQQLCDGLSYSEEEKIFIFQRLGEIAEEDKLTIEALNELCWQDSSNMFDHIFE